MELLLRAGVQSGVWGFVSLVPGPGSWFFGASRVTRCECTVSVIKCKPKPLALARFRFAALIGPLIQMPYRCLFAVRRRPLLSPWP
jgi:hypothetical protein